MVANTASSGITAQLVWHVVEAVCAVVIVAAPGYHLARRGIFTADIQKKLNELTLNYLTPCLIFTKIGGKLNGEKFRELWILLPLFVVISVVPILVAKVVSMCFRFKRRPASFVMAMAVFGNSNSLPISLIYSLAKTVRGLQWDKIPQDNADDVIARGIIYLLILQQLGQILRWSWGVNQLLKPPDEWLEEREETVLEEGTYHDNPTDGGPDSQSSDTLNNTPRAPSPLLPGLEVPQGQQQNGNNASPQPRSRHSSDGADDPKNEPSGIWGRWLRFQKPIIRRYHSIMIYIHIYGENIMRRLPNCVQKCLRALGRFCFKLKDQINMPLVSLVVSLLVAVIEPVRRWFFNKGTWHYNCITLPISELGDTAVPLILVILGAQLVPKALGDEGRGAAASPKQEKQLVLASLLSRMLISPLLLFPLLVVIIKYAGVSVVDDPILAVVVMLVTGSPPALQLSQICQRNGTYMKVLSKIFVWGYVVLILPNTFVLVMGALLIRKWADTGK